MDTSSTDHSKKDRRPKRSGSQTNVWTKKYNADKKTKTKDKHFLMDIWLQKLIFPRN